MYMKQLKCLLETLYNLTKHMNISYVEIKKWINSLAKQISFKPDVLVIIWNWWLIGWYFLAKKLKIKEVVVFNFKSYDWRKRGELEYNNTCIDYCELCRKKKVLIFDDLVDSWETMYKAIALFEWEWDIRTAVLYHKSCSKFNPTYSYKKVGNVWINFIYEDPF